jgi:hypothetical protein
MSDFLSSDIGPSADPSAGVARVNVVQIAPSEVVFSTLVYCENLHCHITLVFTRTHFAWKPMATILLAPFLVMFPPRIFAGVEWTAVELVEFVFRQPDRAQLIRIVWTPGKDDIGVLEFTRITAFSFWITQFRKVGFSPVGDNPFRMTSLRGFLSDYGPTAWVLLLFILLGVFIVALPKFAIMAMLLFPFVATSVGLPLFLWASWKARQWFPPGTYVTLRRYSPQNGKNKCDGHQIWE